MKIKIAKLGMIVGLLVTIIVFPPTVYSEQKGGMSPSTETTTGKTVRVGLSKWCEDGSFKYEVVELPENEYRNLLEKIETCKSPEKAFSIFQEYGLVPKNKTLEDLIEVMKSRVGVVTPLISPSALGAIVWLEINGFFFDLYLPVLFFVAFAPNEGYIWVSELGTGYEGEGNFTDVLLIGWVGIFFPPPTQPVNLGKTTFAGFTLYVNWD